MGDGSNPGTNSVIAYFPTWDLTIFAMANSSESDVDEALLSAVLTTTVNATH